MWTSARALTAFFAGASLLGVALPVHAQGAPADAAAVESDAAIAEPDRPIVPADDPGLRGPVTPQIVAAGDRDGWRESIAQLEQSIVEAETTSGPPPAGLAAQYLELGRLYSASEQYALATAQFSRALEIERRRNGFSTLDQVPVFWEMLHVDEQLGNFFEVRGVEERMVEIAESTDDKAAAVPVLESIADRRVESFERFRELGTPFNILINEKVHDEYSVDIFFNERERALDDLARSRGNYLSAANILRSDGAGGRAEIDVLERKIIRTYYLEATIRGEMTPATAHDLGEEAYFRLIADREGQPEARVGLAMTLVELADWHLVFERYRQALDVYSEAYTMLSAEPGATGVLQDMFTPAVPVLLPSFEPNPLAIAAAGQAANSVEVEIEINQYGRGDVRDILADRRSMPRGLKRDISTFFARARFRPRFEEGEAARDARMTVLYPYEEPVATASE